MRKSRMITYSLTIRCASGRLYSAMEWRYKQDGRPTVRNIDMWVSMFEESMTTGANRHLGADQVLSAEVVDQRTGDTVATWSRKIARPAQPTFRIV